MALRILQFSIVFTIGFCLDPSESLYGPVGKKIDLSIRLSDPRDVTVVKGQSATLKCDARSTLGPILYTWLHNGVPVNSSKMVLQDDGSLYFPKVAGKKAGVYQCLVKNKAGALLSSEARLRVASIDKEFSIQPSNYNVTEQEPVVLHCKIHSTPAAEIQWFFQNQPLPHSTKYVPLRSGALLITKTQYSDSGLYSCKATNILLKKYKYSVTAELTVLQKPADSRAPTLLPLDVSPNVTVLLNENVDLDCAMTGWPIPSIQWRDSNNNIVSNSNSLHIPNVSFRDAANYSCIGSNIAGKVIRNYTLQVYQKPYFNMTPSSKAYPSAITVRLSCNALGFPKPKVYWLKNGKPLEMKTGMELLPTGLLFKQTFSYDSGIYQCVAENAVGKIWTAAQIMINVSHNPSPPENVQCRPYNETSVCLTWQVPKNVDAKAYTIDSLNTDLEGALTNETFKLLTGLKTDTSYKFYIRLYSLSASDQSETVSCQPAKVSERNLQIEKINDTSVHLTWNELITDRPCGGLKGYYIVRWRTSDNSVNVNKTENLELIVTGLLPDIVYEYNIYSTYSKNKGTWQTFPKGNSSYPNNVRHVIAAPDEFQAEVIYYNSVKLTWTSNPYDSANYYIVCYALASEVLKCDDKNSIKSSTTFVIVNKLLSGMWYQFRVRPYSVENVAGEYSKILRVQTKFDVPSPVVNLQYQTVNETTACIYWQAPLMNSGNLQLYVISYAPDSDWPLDQWINVSIPLNQSISDSCWPSDPHVVSFYLKNLNPFNNYTVLVRAASNSGIGKPTLPITVTTDKVQTPDKQKDKPNSSNHTIGILLGIVLTLVCLICCILLVLLRWSCVKRRALARARLTASNNFYPAVARYASHSSSVQVRLEDQCEAEAHEVQQLVKEERTSNIPPMEENTRLDTKGKEEFPNGQANGCVKPYMNGHSVLGYMYHITENPQFYAYERNGHIPNSKIKKESPEYEEDSNSNVATSKFYDLYKLFENSKKSKITSTKECSPHFEHSMNMNSSHDSNTDLNCAANNDDNSLNTTQLTCLDDSIISNHRRVSPILGPNG